MNKVATRSRRLKSGWFRPGKSGYIFYPNGWQGWLISFVWLMAFVSAISAITLWVSNSWLSFALSVLVGWFLLWILQIIARLFGLKRSQES